MNKGFTLVEVMATIVILAVILLVAVPIYNGVRDSINENIYDSKIKEVLAKAESYATENHAFVFDIRTLIEAGEISADNETGTFKDPRTGRDMRCDVINAVYKENRYEVSITESDICYSLEELENLYGMVSLKLYNENNEEIKKLSDTEWIREGTVKVRYEFKEEYKEYEENIENIEWFGECNKENSTDSECIITTNEIQNATVRLELTINMDGVEMKNNVSENILVDLQRPSVIDGSVNVNNDISTNNERRVEFEISDGSGSGVRNFSIVKEKSCDGSEYEENKQTASDGVQSIYLGNGDYYICVEDKVGNKTSNKDLENPKNQIHVEGVDTSIPVISSFTIKSRKNGYNDVDTILTITASDDGGTNSLEMCVSNSGYLQGCSWEKYSASKNWKVTGSLDGQSRTVYLSIRDSAGNIVNREAKYTVYKDCSNQKKEYTDGWSACSDACQVGYQTRNYAMKDKYTGKVCSSGTERKNTVTFSVVSSTIGNNGWYRNISIRANLPSGTSSSKYCITTGTCTPSTNLNINNPTISFTGSSAQKICVQPTGGSVSTCSCCSDSYKVDNVAPTAKISTSCEGSGIKVSASGSSDAYSGIKTYYFSNNGNTWYSSTSNTYTFSNTNSGTFYVKVVDTAGNTSSTVSEAKSCGPLTYNVSGNILTMNLDYTFQNQSTGYRNGNYGIYLAFTNNNSNLYLYYCGDDCSDYSQWTTTRHTYRDTSYITYQTKLYETSTTSVSKENWTYLNKRYYSYRRPNGSYFNGYRSQKITYAEKLDISSKITRVNCEDMSYCNMPRACDSDTHYTCDIRVQLTIKMTNPQLTIDGTIPDEAPNGGNWNGPALTYNQLKLTNMAITLMEMEHDGESGDNDRIVGPYIVDISNAFNDAVQ